MFSMQDPCTRLHGAGGCFQQQQQQQQQQGSVLYCILLTILYVEVHQRDIEQSNLLLKEIH